MGRLDPDDQALVLQRHLGRRLGFHVVEVLLESRAAHAVADDVQEREDAGPGAIDDGLLKSWKLRQPAQPASATVVTPERSVKPSG